MGVLMLIGLLSEIYALVEIFLNENFDGTYPVVYTIILSALLIAVII